MTALQQDIHQTLSNGDSPARLWQAVQERDEGYDGRFVYAVRSTGVYCRPTCPSRRPGRDQVRFFTGPEDAEGAGYRACRRCLPHRPSRLSQQAELVRRACEYIRGRIEDRACRRCLPHRPSRLSQQAELVRRACEYFAGPVERGRRGQPLAFATGIQERDGTHPAAVRSRRPVGAVQGPAPRGQRHVRRDARRRIWLPQPSLRRRKRPVGDDSRQI